MKSKLGSFAVFAIACSVLGFGWHIYRQRNGSMSTIDGATKTLSLYTRLIQPPKAYTAEADRNAKEHDEVTAFGLKAEHFTVLTKDNVKLAARYIPPAHASPRASVIVLHGHGSSKESELWCARSFFAPVDCATIFFDMRAHGESDGEYFTFGAHESSDVKAVLDEVQRRHGQVMKRYARSNVPCRLISLHQCFRTVGGICSRRRSSAPGLRRTAKRKLHRFVLR